MKHNLLSVSCLTFALAACADGSFSGEGSSAKAPATPVQEEEQVITYEDLKNDTNEIPLTVEVKEIGINFEDRSATAQDADFNDAVLCFKGGFSVSKNSVTSNLDQDVIATYYSEAGCTHSIEAKVLAEDGSVVSSKTYTNSDAKVDPMDNKKKKLTEVSLSFKKGQKLELNMTIPSTSSSCVVGTHNMFSEQAKIKLADDDPESYCNR